MSRRSRRGGGGGGGSAPVAPVVLPQDVLDAGEDNYAWQTTNEGADAQDQAMLRRYYGDDDQPHQPQQQEQDDDEYEEEEDEEFDAHSRHHRGRTKQEYVSEDEAMDVRSLPDVEVKPPLTPVPKHEFGAPHSITKVCWYWRWGWCKFADSCHYQHPAREFNTVIRPSANGHARAPSALSVAAGFNQPVSRSAAVFALHAASQRDAQRIRTLETQVGALSQTVVQQSTMLAFAQTSLTSAQISKKQRKREAAAQRVALRQQQQERESFSYGTQGPSSASFERPHYAAAAPAARNRRKRGMDQDNSPLPELALARSEHTLRTELDRQHRRSLDRELDQDVKRGLATIHEF